MNENNLLPEIKDTEFYHALYNNYLCGIIQYYGTPDNMRIISANPMSQKLYGINLPDDYYRTHEVYIGEYTESSFKDAFISKLNSLNVVGDMVSYENMVRREDGSNLWVSGEARLISSENGKKHIICLLMDATEHKEHEIKLQEERDKYDQTFQNLPCGIIQFTDEEIPKILKYNRSAWKFFNYYVEEDFAASIRNGKTLHIFEEDIPYTVMLRERMKKHSRPFNFEHRVVCVDGEVKWMYGQVEKCSGQNEEACYQCAFIENTAQREEQLKKETDYKNEVYYMSNVSDRLISKYRFNITRNTMEWYKAKEEVAIKDAAEMEYDRFLDILVGQIVDREEQEQTKNLLNREQLRENFKKGQNSVEVEFRRKNRSKRFVWMKLLIRLVQEPNTRDLTGFAYTSEANEARQGETTSTMLVNRFYTCIMDRMYAYVIALDYDRMIYDLIQYHSLDENTIDISNTISYLTDSFCNNYGEASYPYIEALKDLKKLKGKFENGENYFKFEAASRLNPAICLEHTVVPVESDHGKNLYFLMIGNNWGKSQDDELRQA